jgi:hypothetical protein
MLRRITPQESIGKCIKSITGTNGERVSAIILEDDSFVPIRILTEYYGETSLDFDQQLYIKSRRDLYDMRDMGVITEEEFTKYIEKTR